MNHDRARVCVIGLGYIGLPTAALLARVGHDVVGVDINPSAVETINQGRIHIVEPDLDAAVRDAVASGRLRATGTPEPADVYLICVPTPFHAGDSAIPQPNLDYVFAATRAIAGVVRRGNLVILESTSPVGTTEQVRERLAAEGAPVDEIAIAYCPERVLPGRVLAELVSNDRVVGGLDATATERGAEFYAAFVAGEILTTDARTAEMTKLIENSFRDVNIAFANEVSMLAERLTIDPWELIRLANHHPRVNILQPGTGVGGHCVAVDPWFIVSADPERSRLIATARHVNLAKTAWVVDKVVAAVHEARDRLGREPLVACFGLAFKPNVDDLRESPALTVATSLVARGVDVVAVEPHIAHHPALELVAADDAARRADIVALLVKHDAFTSVRFDGKAILDFCGALASSVGGHSEPKPPALATP